MTINPWINFNGNAEEAFRFYQSVLGGEFTKVIRMQDLASSEFPVAAEEADNIMQIVLQINDSQSLIGNDVPSFMGRVNENENRSKIQLIVESQSEVERVVAALSVGGQIEVPLSDSPWGTVFAMFRDRYGIEWIIEFDSNQQSLSSTNKCNTLR